MPSGRGLVVFAAGVALWITARVLGSPNLHIVAVGLVALPFVAALFAIRSRGHLTIHRHLSESRVAPGAHVTVDIRIRNGSSASTSFLLLEDRLPTALGRPARLVLGGIPGRAETTVSYSLVPQIRGRYVVGPFAVDVSDPFALTRRRTVFDERDELLVTPEVEELGGPGSDAHGATSGLSHSRQLFRTGEEFYTMRPYQIGDDLRRIHWKSVARTGELMIRQDESSRRGSGVVLLDNRGTSMGQLHTEAFEKGVSAAASLGVLLTRAGFSVQFATVDMPLARVAEDQMLEALASVSHSPSRSTTAALARLRSAASMDTSLAVVTAPPEAGELAALIRAGTVFGPKLAVLVYPVEPSSLPPDRQATLEGRASSARLSLARSGWDVMVLHPSDRLRDAWHATRGPIHAASV